MNIIYSEDLGEYVVINIDYLYNEKDLAHIKMYGNRIIGGVTFFYKDLLTMGEIRARIGSSEPLVAVYIKDTNDFYMFHSETKTMCHKVN